MQFNLSDFICVVTFFTALRVVFSRSEPMAVALTSLAIKKKVHPASRIFRSSPLAFLFLSNFQPFEYGSPSSCRYSGKRAPSLRRMAPGLIFSGIRFSFIYTGPLGHPPSGRLGRTASSNKLSFGRGNGDFALWRPI